MKTTKKTIFKRFSSDLKNAFKQNGIILNLNGKPIQEDLYLCPISLTLHSIDSLKSGGLTLEHVPPMSLGGKGLVLISKNINNKDGHTSDKKLLQYFQTKNFLENGQEIDAKISAESLEMKNVTTKFSFKKAGLLEEEIAQAKLLTSKKNVKAMKFKGVFDNWDGLELKVSMKMQFKLDLKTMLKCAYLVAFSQIGYQLLFDKHEFKASTYGVLMDVLAGDKEVNDFPSVVKKDHFTSGKGNIGLIRKPIELRSLFVNLTFKLDSKIHKYTVFLPHPDSPNLKELKGFKTFLKNEKNSKLNIHFTQFNNQLLK